jgi:arsenate reductase
MSFSVGVGMLVVLYGGAAPHRAEPPRPSGAVERADVVFVCTHGNVKSLIAAEWFNLLAAERGIASRAVARGLAPENPVPAAIAERLRRDGIDVSGFEARPLASPDVERASRLVAIGVEAPAWVGRSGLVVETWDGIPPASERYDESRDAMRVRIERILDALKAPKPAR